MNYTNELSENKTNQILKERARNYGDYDDCANKTLRILDEVLGEDFVRGTEIENIIYTTVFMIALKLSRISSNPFYMDSWVDVSGYAELMTKELEKYHNKNQIENKTRSL